MPPRFAYWTILIDNAPTAFRAHDAQELLPTLAQLKRTNDNVVLKWFSGGQLWDSPEAAREARRRPPAVFEKRGADWRPGGQHKDPRARFERKKKPRPDRFAKPWQGKPAGQGFRPAGPPKPWGKPAGPGGSRKPWDRPAGAAGPRKPWGSAPGSRGARKPWGKPPGVGGPRKPWGKPPAARDQRFAKPSDDRRPPPQGGPRPPKREWREGGRDRPFPRKPRDDE